MSRRSVFVGTVLAATGAGVGAADAQPLGTFGWQLQPFCNRVTVNVTQNGAIYTLDGYDDQCGAAQRAPLVGLATPNPDGTIGLGFSIVTVPGGTPVHVEARILLPGADGTWRDSAGNSGGFALNGGGSGSARPAPTAFGPWGAVVDAPDSYSSSGLVLKRAIAPGTVDAPALVVEWGPASSFLAPPASAVMATTANRAALVGVSDSSVGVYGGSGTGTGVAGLTGSGVAVAGATLTTGIGVAGKSTSGTGVLAESGGSGTALEVKSGPIKVSGTVRPVFQHTAKPANLTGNRTILDHPLTNGDPNAMVFVQHVFVTGESEVYDPRVTGVWYDGALGRWTIYHDDLSAIAPETRYNVFVVKR